MSTDRFWAFEWIRKNKKHKNKSIGFLFKFAKINRRKNIQIYGGTQFSQVFFYIIELRKKNMRLSDVIL